jgi:choline monooxygenase
MPFGQFYLEPSRARDYLVRANWALYCDNYLEGFHIPFIHASLNSVIDYGSYTTEVYDWCNLQLGIAASGEPCFDLPKDSPDSSRRIAAYYYWVFPNLMLNFYPWGLSVNLVRPLGPELTRVSFLPYVWDASKLDSGAGAALDRVEREDEVVVEAVQKGVKSRFYDRGRFSVAREQGVHHFHRLLAQTLG